MDEKTVHFSEKRHNKIEIETWNFVSRTGFNKDKILFVPISGFNGDNMKERSNDSPGTKARRSSRHLTTSRSCPPC